MKTKLSLMLAFVLAFALAPSVLAKKSEKAETKTAVSQSASAKVVERESMKKKTLRKQKAKKVKRSARPRFPVVPGLLNPNKVYALGKSSKFQSAQEIALIQKAVCLLGGSIRKDKKGHWGKGTRAGLAQVQFAHGILSEGFRSGPVSTTLLNNALLKDMRAKRPFIQKVALAPFSYIGDVSRSIADLTKRLKDGPPTFTTYSTTEKGCDYDTAKRRSCAGPRLRQQTKGRAGSFAGGEFVREGDLVILDNGKKAIKALSHDRGDAVDLDIAGRHKGPVYDIFTGIRLQRLHFPTVKILRYTGVTPFRQLPRVVKEQFFVLSNWKTGTFVLPSGLSRQYGPLLAAR